MILKALELAHRPSQKRLIDVSEQGVQRRWRVSPVVLDPPSQERVEPLGNVSQRQLCLTAKIQVPNHRPHGLHRRGADCGVKAAEQCVISETPNQTGPKAVPEEIELNIRIRASTLAVLAVNDLGFGRMQF